MANQCGVTWETDRYMGRGKLAHRCTTEGVHSVCFCGTCGDEKDREVDRGE